MNDVTLNMKHDIFTLRYCPPHQLSHTCFMIINFSMANHLAALQEKKVARYVTASWLNGLLADIYRV